MNSLYKKGLSLVQQLINIEKNHSYEDNFFFFFSGLSSFSNTSANESTSKEDTTDN